MVPTYIRNKYSIAAILFFTWLCFFDRNDLISQFRLVSERNDKQNQIEFYETKIKEVRKEKAQLLENPEELERYARETYKMKKENEDLYIIIEEE